MQILPLFYQQLLIQGLSISRVDNLLWLLPILFHRVGLILSVVGTTILVFIPAIYPQDDDLAFATSLSRLLHWLTRFGLALLVITGSIRIQSGLPSAFFLKLVGVTFTLIWAFFRTPIYPDDNYQQSHLILFALLIVTSLIGIYL